MAIFFYTQGKEAVARDFLFFFRESSHLYIYTFTTGSGLESRLTRLQVRGCTVQ